MDPEIRKRARTLEALWRLGLAEDRRTAPGPGKGRLASAETNTRSGSQRRASETSCWSLSLEDSSSFSCSGGGRVRLLKGRLSSDVSEARTRRAARSRSWAERPMLQAPKAQAPSQELDGENAGPAGHGPRGQGEVSGFNNVPRTTRTRTISDNLSTGGHLMGWHVSHPFLPVPCRQAASKGHHTEHF